VLTKHRLKALERQHRTEIGDDGGKADDLTAEEWLEVFEAWATDPDFATNDPYTRFLAEYRQVLAHYQAGPEPWEPPDHFLTRRPLPERRHRWRMRYPTSWSGITCARNGVLTAALWVHPEDECDPPAEG
jgi:hypothetical protein